MAANAPQSISVGKLGEVFLGPGGYLYVGSARRTLAARIRRHCLPEKKRRWHIDYLLHGGALHLEEIWVAGHIAECRLAAGLLLLPQVSVPKARLGASDCRCPAHFLRCEQPRPDLQDYLCTLGFSLYSPA